MKNLDILQKRKEGKILMEPIKAPLQEVEEGFQTQAQAQVQVALLQDMTQKD